MVFLDPQQRVLLMFSLSHFLRPLDLEPLEPLKEQLRPLPLDPEWRRCPTPMLEVKLMSRLSPTTSTAEQVLSLKVKLVLNLTVALKQTDLDLLWQTPVPSKPLQQ